MHISITAFYAALLGLIFVRLSTRTIQLRRKVKTALGDGDDAELKRAIRAHANFSEYTPIGLLLIGMGENLGTYPLLVHALGFFLLCGRCLHAYGLSQVKEDYRFRIFGIKMTLNVIIVSALAIIWMLIFA